MEDQVPDFQMSGPLLELELELSWYYGVDPHPVSGLNKWVGFC